MPPSSPSSPVCLPTEHGARIHLALLGMALLAGMACLCQSALPTAAQALLACLALVYAGSCARWMTHTPRAVLRLRGDAIHLRHAGGLKQRVTDVRWHDYGHLVVLHCRIDGSAAGYCWWIHGLPAGRRRRLRLAIRAWVRQPPSLLVNPLL